MSRIVWLVFVGVFTFNSAILNPEPAAASNLEDLIGGIVGGVIQNAQRKKQIRRQERQYRSEQKRVQDEENKRLVLHFKRVQTALKKLGFYKSKVDGDFGAGSQAAYSKYLSAFNLPFIDPIFLDMYELEERAEAGWKSGEEFNSAKAAGFYNRDEYIAAKKSGFRDRDVWQTASQLGFKTQREYAEFLNSGYKDVAEFKAEKTKIVKARRVAEKCQSAVADKKWIAAEKNCAFALALTPNDRVISASHSRAVREVDRIVERAYDQRQAALDVIQPEEGSTDTNQPVDKPVDIGKAQTSLKKATILIAEVELRRGVFNCEALKSTGAIADTIEQCKPILEEYSELAFSNASIVENRTKLVKIISSAEVEMAKLDEKAAEKQTVIAHENALQRSEELIANLSTYVASGAKFKKPIEIAQALANLRKLNSAASTNFIETKISALADLIEQDANFVKFISQKNEALKNAKSHALLQTRINVQKMDAFIGNFVANNLLDERVGDLLQIRSTLSEALTSGNEDRLKTADVNGMEQLAALSLQSELSGFAYTPEGVVVSKEDVVKSENEIEHSKAALKESVKSANVLMGGIKKFSDDRQKFKAPIKVATLVAGLRKELSKEDAKEIQLKVSALNEQLNNEPGYTKFSQSLNSAANASLANAAAKSREYLKVSEAFLVEYIGNNITADNLGLLIDEKEKITTSLQTGTDENVVAVKSRFELFAEQHELAKEFDSFKQLASQKNVSEDTALAGNGLAINPVNENLLKGHAEDLLVLRNTTPTAPHVGKNILGYVRFEGDNASLCWAHDKPLVDTAVRLTLSKIKKAGGEQIKIFECTADTLLAHDLIVLKRGGFLNGTVEFASVVVEAFEEEKLVEFIKTEKAEIEQYNLINGADSLQLANEVSAGVKDGYGIVHIQNGSNALCVSNSSDIEAHRQIIKDDVENLETLLLGEFEVSEHSFEQAYVLSQRSKCGSIYASALELKDLLSALVREKQSYVVIPKWIENNEFLETKAYLESIKSATDKELALKSQQRQGRLSLEKAKFEKAEADRLARQAALRDRHVKDAMSILEPLRVSVEANIMNGTPSEELSLFERFGKKITDLKNNLWNFNKVDYSLVDYGTAEWQGREVPAVLARFFIKSDNAAQGVSRTDCAIVGYLIDEKFNQKRDPIYMGCEQEAGLSNWLGSRNFTSLWNVK